MSVRFARVSLLGSCALMCAQAMGQSVVPPQVTANAAAAVVPAAKSEAQPPSGQRMAAVGRPMTPAAVTVVQAAGSVNILADGIVANVKQAHIQAPAPGFVYER